MPSMAHEVLVDLLKNRPPLGAELLSEGLGIELPAYSEAKIASIDVTQIQPAEYRADVVVALYEGGEKVYVLISEVQLHIDPDKRWTWPVYTTGVRAVHKCPVGLLVIAPDSAVAGWCQEPIETGIPGFVLRPPVMSRAAIPVITDPAEVRRRPELAVLSTMAHADDDLAVEIAAATLPAVRGLEDERAVFYADLVLHSLNEAARRALETKMKGYEYQSDFAKKYVAEGFSKGRAEGLREGLSEGRAEGLSEGRAEGLSEGRAEGLAQSVLTVLRARQVNVPESLRERILTEKDLPRLSRWLERAAVATSVTDLLEEAN